MRIAPAKRWVMALAGIAVVGVAGSASAAAIGASRPRPQTLAHRAHHVPASMQTHLLAGPYISPATAYARALAEAVFIGSGARVLTAQLLTARVASAATGQQVPGYPPGSARMVWLVWLRGPWRILNCVEASLCPVILHQIYYIAIDAKTGVSDGMGWSRAYQAGPRR